MYEVLNKLKTKINSSKILTKLNLKKGKYILVSCHREENIENKKSFNKLMQTLNCLCDNYNLPVIFSTHPRTRKIIDSKKPNLNKLIQLFEPFGFIDYNNLQINSFVVLSDSGTISEESSILNFRALNIRESHERPEAMKEASVILTGLDYSRIIQGISCIQQQLTSDKRNIKLPVDYSKDNISIKVERIILSYIDYVNRVVWQKES